MRAALALSLVAQLVAAPVWAGAPATSQRPLPRPLLSASMATANVAAALSAASRPTPRPAGIALAGMVPVGMVPVVVAQAGEVAVPSASLVSAALRVAAQGGAQGAAQGAQAATGGARLAADRARARPATAASAAPVPEVARLATLMPLTRPLARPKGMAVAPMALDPRRANPPASLVGPATPARPSVPVDRIAFVAPVLPNALINRKGALCGTPTLQGRTVSPVVSRVKGCGVAQPVEITAVDGVPLSTPATLDCNTAITLDRWVRTALKRAVGGQGGGVSRILIAGSYTCRPMNSIRGNKISEHGRGHAVDISGIVLRDGTTVTVARDWKKRDTGPMLKAAYRAGCGMFGTTLGPGSDGHHEDHLHFDTAPRPRGAYCR